MNNSDTNLSNQLPFEQLAKLGLDHEKVEKLPQEVKEKLIKGEVTPLMEVTLPARNGMVISLPLQLQPGTKLAILLISCVAMWGGIGYAFHYFGQPSKRAQSVAEKALMASVDNPESVKVIAVSKPDSVFGRNYINNDEKMAIAMSMMKVNEQVMSRTDGLQNLNFEDNAVSELVGRQMSAMSALRSMVGFETPDAPRKPFSGWKVKIEYEALSESGSLYRSEYWFILDRDAQCVVNSFEIPLL